MRPITRRMSMSLGIRHVPYILKIPALFGANLIGYWPFNDAAGSAVSYGAVAGCDAGAAGGPTYSEPGIGDGNTSILFDGVNDGFTANADPFKTAFNELEGAAMLWIKAANAGVWTDGVVRFLLWFYHASAAINVVKNSDNTTYGQMTPTGTVFTTITSTDWVHLAITWSQSLDFFRFYVNGVQIGIDQTFTAGMTDISALYISYFWSGWMAHVIVLDRAATGPEIVKAATK